jgi:hypothetical protein
MAFPSPRAAGEHPRRRGQGQHHHGKLGRRRLHQTVARTITITTRAVRAETVLVVEDGYHREVSRVGKRYLQGGLAKALSEEPRPKPAPMLDSTQQAALVAMVCGPPPEGRARWTVRLLAVEAGKRGVVDKVGRETVRIVHARHDLKPWREKDVVRSRKQR